MCVCLGGDGLKTKCLRVVVVPRETRWRRNNRTQCELCVDVSSDGVRHHLSGSGHAFLGKKINKKGFFFLLCSEVNVYCDTSRVTSVLQNHCS